MRFKVASSVTFEPCALWYRKPLPLRFRRMPGFSSLTYARPAYSAASFTSTIASAVERSSMDALGSGKTAIINDSGALSVRLGRRPDVWGAVERGGEARLTLSEVPRYHRG